MSRRIGALHADPSSRLSRNFRSLESSGNMKRLVNTRIHRHSRRVITTMIEGFGHICKTYTPSALQLMAARPGEGKTARSGYMHLDSDTLRPHLIATVGL